MPHYQLVRDGVLLGTLTRTHTESFHAQGRFEPTAEFEAVRPLFDRMRGLIEADRMEEAGAVDGELSAGLRMVPLDGRAPIAVFFLNIDGDWAWWRY